METPDSFAGLVSLVLDFIAILIPAIFSILFVYIVWKIIDAWVLNAGDEQKRAEGKQLMVVAVFVFVLMITTWGIVALIKNSIFG